MLMNLDYYYETGLLYFESGNIDIFNLSDNFYNDICYDETYSLNDVISTNSSI